MNVWIPETRRADSVAVATLLGEDLFRLGASIDAAASFPSTALARLEAAGLLVAPLALEYGGADLGLSGRSLELFDVLRRIGGGDLSTGRLYEGHVNALLLVQRFGRAEQVSTLADALSRGALSAVWNAEGSEPLRLVPDRHGYRIEGRKILASGAGSITHPLVTGLIGEDVVMLLPRLDGKSRSDLSRWTPSGMRSSMTGTMDLTGLSVTHEDIIGAAGDYKRQPVFSGGAWRFCAVQLGAIERLVDLFRQGLTERGRGQDPHQQARVAACVAAAETAALWISKAARLVDEEGLSSADVVAYAGLTRMVTERAGLDVMEHVHRGIGLMSFMQPDPIERISRDLATYLRQPAPDGAMSDAAASVLAAPSPLRDLWRVG